MTMASMRTILQMLIALFGILSAAPISAPGAELVAQNVIVYYEPGRFVGWPANNGVWSWDNEILVGFSRGHFKANESGHSVDRDKENHTALARSLDGGETWKLEEPESLARSEDNPKPLPGGIRFDDPNFALRVDRDQFRVSYDRGHTWEGPYDLSASFGFKLTSRTDYLVNGEDDCFFFLSSEQPEIKAASYRDRAFCARTTDGGKTLKFVSWMTGEPLTVRSVMPTTVRTAPSQLLSVLRRREGDHCWIDACGSDDNGASWKLRGKVVDLPGKNGNPPSVVRLPDGRLCAAYGTRAEPYGICAKVSADSGQTWGEEILLRCDGRNWDLGYTRTVVRSDGKLVTLYYFTYRGEAGATHRRHHLAASGNSLTGPRFESD
jgi:hypothetical protein